MLTLETTRAPQKGIPALSIVLFGPMQVFIDGQPLSHLRSRKALALLALLALRQGITVERDWLAGMLWPDADPQQAAASLRPVLSELRRALGDQAGLLQSPGRYSLRLELEGVHVDVAEFDMAIRSRKTSALEQAIGLYQGALLEGIAEEWASQERDAREQDCLRALGILAETAQAASDTAAAVGWFRRALGLAPGWEAARRGLMETLATNGDSNGAVQVYRELVEFLRSDPKAVPDEKTSALYRRLRTDARQRAAEPVSERLPASMKSLQKVSGYLPHPITELVGREDERIEVASRLRRSRLVTLTGPGGIGKTRLALAVAADAVLDYADGVWLVAFDALSDGGLFARQIASALGLKEEADRNCLVVVTEYLRSKRLLLVLDNCEHLLEAAAKVAGQLLRECVGIRILATSREALGITGETAWSLPALAVPDPAHLPLGQTTLQRVLMGYEGVQLFVERAQAAQKTFMLTRENARAVAQVCARLEGLPLAIELAAARIKALTVEQIAVRMDDHLGLLTGGSRVAQTRQQTLRATLDWSYELLSEAERLLLGRLAVFAGGWDLEAAEQICSGGKIAASQVLDLLTSLVDKSLVIFDEAEVEGRYRLLETVRQYAAERLKTSGGESLNVRHRAWFLSLAEDAEAHLTGCRQQAWLGRLEAEHDNLRAALAWTNPDGSGTEMALRLAGALGLFWSLRGYFSEGRNYLCLALEQVGAQARTRERGKALLGAGSLAYHQGDYNPAQRLLAEGLDIFKELEDRQGTANSFHALGNLALAGSEHVLAGELYDESLHLRRETGDERGTAHSLNALGNLANAQGDFVLSWSLYEEALYIYRSLDEKSGIALALGNLGNVALSLSKYAEGQALLEESLSLRREIDDKRGIMWALGSLGHFVYTQGDYLQAQSLYEESLRRARDLGSRRNEALALLGLARAFHSLGRRAEAQVFFAESLAISRELKDRKNAAWALKGLGKLAYEKADYVQARQFYQENLTLLAELKDQGEMAAGLSDLAEMLSLLGQSQKAVHLWAMAQVIYEAISLPLAPSDQEKYNQQIQQARAALGTVAFTTAWEEGLALTWEQAAAYAFEETQTISPNSDRSFLAGVAGNRPAH